MQRKPARGAAAWRKRKAAWLAAHPACWGAGRVGLDVAGAHVCDGVMDANHIIPRGAGGTRNDDLPLVTLCRRLHQYAEEHREWARSNGLLARRKATR